MKNEAPPNPIAVKALLFMIKRGEANITTTSVVQHDGSMKRFSFYKIKIR